MLATDAPVQYPEQVEADDWQTGRRDENEDRYDYDAPPVGTDPDLLRPAPVQEVAHAGAITYRDIWAALSDRIQEVEKKLTPNFTLRAGMIHLHTDYQSLRQEFTQLDDTWQRLIAQVRAERITATDTGAVAVGPLLDRVFDMMATCAWFAVEASVRPIVMPRQGVATLAD